MRARQARTVRWCRGGDEDPALAEIDPCGHRLGSEGCGQRGGDRPSLQRAEHRDREDRRRARQDEHAFALLHAELAQRAGEAVARAGEFRIAELDRRYPAAEHPQRRAAGERTLRVAVDRLVREVQPAARQALQRVGRTRPAEAAALLGVVGEMRRYAQILRAFANEQGFPHARLPGDPDSCGEDRVAR